MAKNIENQPIEQSEQFKPAVDLAERVDLYETADFVIPVETPAEHAEKVDSARNDVLKVLEARKKSELAEVAAEPDLTPVERNTYTSDQMAARGLRPTNYTPEQATLEFVQQRGSVLDTEPPRAKTTRFLKALPFVYPFVQKNAA